MLNPLDNEAKLVKKMKKVTVVIFHILIFLPIKNRVSILYYIFKIRFFFPSTNEKVSLELDFPVAQIMKTENISSDRSITGRQLDDLEVLVQTLTGTYQLVFLAAG